MFEYSDSEIILIQKNPIMIKLLVGLMMLHSSFISNWAGCVAHFTEAEMVPMTHGVKPLMMRIHTPVKSPNKAIGIGVCWSASNYVLKFKDKTDFVGKIKSHS
jgi:hypothetical protein